MSTFGRAVVLTVVASLAPGIVACGNVLGIESATHDPALDHAGTGGSNGGGDGGNEPKTLCETYCDTVMANCAGSTPVYRSRPVCDAVCAALPPGKAGDTTGNSVQCRLHYARNVPILGEEALTCAQAGPGGDGMCGENCEGFCAIADVACAAAPIASNFIGAPCAAACAKLPSKPEYNSNTETGNSIECRLYHVSAATVDPQTHCKHVVGIGACTDPAP